MKNKYINSMIMLIMISGIHLKAANIIMEFNDKDLKIILQNNSYKTTIMKCARTLKNEILQAELLKNNITIKDKEIKSIMEFYFKDLGFNSEIAAQLIQSIDLRLKALKKVYIDNDNSDLIYNEILKGKVSETEWKSLLKKYNSKHKIAEYEMLAPKSKEDMLSKTFSSFKMDLYKWVLLNKLKSNFQITEKETEEKNKLLESKNQGTTSKMNKDTIHSLLLQEKFRQWWENCITQYKINIPNKYKKDVMSKLEVIQSPSFTSEMNTYLSKKFLN